MVNTSPRRVVRRVVALLSAVVLAGAISSCADGEDAEPGTDRSTTSTEAPAAPAAEPVEPVEVAAEDELYAIPDPIPDVDPGTLLRYQVMDESVTEAGTTYRIMYVSRSLAEDPIVVTGVAVVPDAPPATGGRPIVSIGHGTTGVADVCAPSRQAPREALLGALAVERGWITAISDYEGLGTPGRHPYLVGESQGRGVLDAARAVAQLPGAETSPQLLLAGYSQGGQAVLFARELAEGWAPELEVVGTAAGAPVSQLRELFELMVDGPQAGFGYMMLAGFNAVWPDEADLSSILTPEGQEWLDVVDDGCKDEVFEAVAEHDADALLTPERGGAGSWPQLFDRNDPGRVAVDTPVMVLHNEQDEVIPFSFSETLVADMCDLGDTVALARLADATHMDAGPPAYVEAFAWFDDLLEGTSPASTCAGP